MDTIYNLESDSSMLDELWDCIRNRNIEQKFLYQWDWAELYYLQKHSNKMYTGHTLEKNDFLDFYKKNIEINSSWNLDIISLGCGNSENEVSILENINTKNISYYWVDSSKSMLELSVENLKHLNLNKKFICTDFSTNIFRQELQQLTFNSDDKVFVFFSNTFWNIQHTNIIDILQNLLNKGEKLWLDLRTRKWETIEDDLEISTILADDLHRTEVRNSFLEILKWYWVDTSSWELILKTTKVDIIDALKFEFSFLLKEKSILDVKWQKIVILPWETIKIQQIYSFSPTWLINFFEEHWFKLIDKQTKWYRWQFLFEKK